MSARASRAALGASLLLALAACSSDNGSTGTSPEQTFPASMVETFGSTGELLGEYAHRAIDFGGSNVGFAPGVVSTGAASFANQRLAQLSALAHLQGKGPMLSSAFLSAGCAPTVTGSGTDTDADGIPDDMLVTYTAANCTMTDTATGDIAVSRGTLHYRDTNDDLYGFDLTVTDLRQDSYDGSSHDWSHSIINVHETAKTSTTGGTWSLNIDADLADGTADTVQTSQKVSYAVTGKIVSNGSIPAGGPMPDGTLTLGGKLDATLPTAGRLIVDLVTTDPIHYESSCGGNSSGKLELRLNGRTDEGVLIKWLDCDLASWEFLGSGTL